MDGVDPCWPIAVCGCDGVFWSAVHYLCAWMGRGWCRGLRGRRGMLGWLDRWDWVYFGGCVPCVPVAGAACGESLLGVCMLLQVLFFYLPRLVTHVHDPRPWTSGFEILAMSGASFVLAANAAG